MRYLLDKNIVRHALSGLHYGHQRLLSSAEVGALSFWRNAEVVGAKLYISHSSFHILERMSGYREVQLLFAATEVYYPSRYFVRWSRRVRQTSKLTREDAAMIALSTFGTNHLETILGVETLITYDQRMIRGYEEHCDSLQNRLSAMTRQLSLPYHYARLPDLSLPDQVMFN